jgi:hypothetical protein
MRSFFPSFKNLVDAKLASDDVHRTGENDDITGALSFHEVNPIIIINRGLQKLLPCPSLPASNISEKFGNPHLMQSFKNQESHQNLEVNLRAVPFFYDGGGWAGGAIHWVSFFFFSNSAGGISFNAQHKRKRKSTSFSRRKVFLPSCAFFTFFFPNNWNPSPGKVLTTCWRFLPRVVKLNEFFSS